MVEEKYKADCSGLADVDANLFRAAHVCVSNEETRYYLNGVRIERHPKGGIILVATDGCRLVVIRDADGWCKKPVTVRLPRAGIDACRPPKKFVEKPQPRLIVSKQGIARIGDAFTSPTKATIDGTYPEWRKCIPVKKWKFGTASFNAGYIADFGKIAEILESSTRCIRLLVDDERSPALVLFPHNDDAFGVLMPMLAEVGRGLPLWMKPVMKGAKAA